MLSLLDTAVQQGARLERCCGVLGVSERTIKRWRKGAQRDLRAGPKTSPSHSLTEAEQDAIVAVANQPEYRNLSPEQVVAKLTDEGRYICSESSLRRVLAKRRLNRRRQRSRVATGHKPREYVAHEPLRVFSWDITYLKSATVRGAYFYLYLFIDIWSRRIVGAEVHEIQQSELAADLLLRVCDEHSLNTEGLVVHADNGAPMKGSTMLATLHELGITASFSRPGVSDDNAFVEALFRHLKYAPSYPRHGFVDLDEARAWVLRFVAWYNTEHLHSAIGLVTPDDRHYGRDIAMLSARRAVYAAAQARHPSRWTTATRRWDRPAIVTLNPDRVVIASPKASAA